MPEHGAGLNDSAGKQVLIARQEDSQHTVTAESKADFNQSLERAQGYNGRWQKAEVFYKRTVAVEEIFLGFTHSKVLDTVFCLGCHYLNYGNLSEAEKLFVRASRDREAPGANQRIKLDTDEIWMKN